jgi:hypothetical protein
VEGDEPSANLKDELAMLEDNEQQQNEEAHYEEERHEEESEDVSH